MARSGCWFRVAFEIPEPLCDAVTEVLHAFGSSGQEIRESHDPGRIEVIAYFSPRTPCDTLNADLKAALAEAVAGGGRPTSGAGLTVAISAVADTDWHTGWQAYFRPIHVAGRICVCPPWDRQPDPPGGFTIVIEPRMAFGTGHHETTRLALRRMVTEVRPGQRVLDVGCGSGILSIAAAGLGASAVVAVDTDAEAVTNTRTNAEINGVAQQIRVTQGSARDAAGRYDLVVANIISSALVPILPDIAQRVEAGGRALLGGLLKSERAWFGDEARRAGLHLTEVDEEGEWTAFVAARTSDGV